MDAKAFEAKYDPWLESVRPLLEAADWKGAFATYPHVVNETSPWTPFQKRLADCRVGLVTTAGMYIEGEQQPFDASNIEGDWTHREIPADTPIDRLRIAHTHYNHERALEDPNIVFPVERLRDLEEDGTIGAFVSPVISIAGYSPAAHRLVEQTAPRIVAAFHRARADLVLQVPV